MFHLLNYIIFLILSLVLFLVYQYKLELIGDYDVAKTYERIRDENYKKDEQLSMIIKEIEKRVS